jgi:hypothetical protein
MCKFLQPNMGNGSLIPAEKPYFSGAVVNIVIVGVAPGADVMIF